MGVFAALGRGRTLVGPLLLLGVVFPACLPREDLASYTNASGSGGSLQGPAAGGMSSDAGDVPGGEGNPGGLPLDPGGMGGLGGADASALAMGDAGELSDAGTSDGGAQLVDAGAAAILCASTQGTLVPNSNVCLFVAVQARVSWQAASLACQSRSSTLASLKTPQLDVLLGTLISTDTWIGANDASMDPAANNFVWRDGTEVSSALGWAPGEPDAVADQFCVSKAPQGMGGQWRDRPCSELKAYVCEREL